VGPGQRSTGSDNRLKFGRVDGLGSEFVKQMGEKALDGTTGGATMPGSFFDPRLRELPHRKLFVRSLIPTTRVNSDKVAYIRQTVLTNNAAAVAAGALKPTSVITAAREEAPIRVIAHISEALDRSMLSDYDQLIRFIDDQLRLGVLLEEERQILLGSGVAPNLTGILTTVGIQTQAKGADPVPDAVHKAITKVRNVFGAGCRRDASE
jgi:HK97 family phage major capsid protein